MQIESPVVVLDEICCIAPAKILKFPVLKPFEFTGSAIFGAHEPVMGFILLSSTYFFFVGI